MSNFGDIKALAFDHYGTLFDKHAVYKVIDEDFPGHGDEMAKLWFLTMASPWMVEASQKNAGVEHLFKKVISSEPHHVYKPGNRAYDLGVEEIGLPKEQIGAAHYGFPVFWINRIDRPLDEMATVLGA